jgi:hypothetical protein
MLRDSGMPTIEIATAELPVCWPFGTIRRKINELLSLSDKDKSEWLAWREGVIEGLSIQTYHPTYVARSSSNASPCQA